MSDPIPLFAQINPAEQVTEVRLTEPVLVSTIFVSGMTMDESAHVVRFTGWDTVADVYDGEPERRVAVRFTTSLDVARKMIEEWSIRLRGARMN